MRKIFSLVVAALVLFSCKDDTVHLSPGIQVTVDTASEKSLPDHFYVLNEDWFGHDNGTLNMFTKRSDQYEASYRVYRSANPGEMLGVTSCYAQIWGENMYIVSKQENRLVVADATSLKKKTVIENLGGDGRSFLGIDDQKAYISLDNGIVIFDLVNQTIGEKIKDVNEQIGSMVYLNGRVFSISSRKLYVIDETTDTVEKEISGSFLQLTSMSNGQVVAADNQKFFFINSVTLEIEEVACPEGAGVADSWGAWNAGSLCADLESKNLYWTVGGSMFSGGKKLYVMNVETKESKLIFSAGNSDRGTQMEFYGAGCRIDPTTGELVLLLKHSGWGDATMYNYIYLLDSEGNEITHFEVLDEDGKNYYWFPSMPVFVDVNKPQILLNSISMVEQDGLQIDLREQIVDYDNTFVSMVISAKAENERVARVSVEDGKLNIMAGPDKGMTQCLVSVVSNGVKVTRSVDIYNR